MPDEEEEVLNPDAINADFPTGDQLKALIARRDDLLETLDETDERDWVNNPNDEVREALRAVASEERRVERQLNAASAILQRDFDLSQD
ncbi:MAG: hypothetical protein AAGA74_16195 [Pseudomonadota bacterium]